MTQRYFPLSFLVVTLLFTHYNSVYAQVPLDQYNYIKETTVQVPVTTESQVTSLQTGGKNVLWSYFDGLGRHIQTVQVQGSPSLKDIVLPVKYDPVGRQDVKYLPWISNGTTGAFVPDVLGSTNYTSSSHYNFYNNGSGDKIADDLMPFARTVYEPSPLNRILKQGATGETWQPLTFPEYHFQKWDYHDFHANPVGGGGTDVELTIQDNVLTVKFNANFSSTPLVTGAIKSITCYPALPDMRLGLIALGKYHVSIKNNHLFIEATTVPAESVTGFGMAAGNPITILPIQLNPFFQHWDYHDFLANPVSGGGSDVEVKVQRDVLTVKFSAGFVSTPLKTGAIKPILSMKPLPDMVLGTIATGYTASIKDNFLFIESPSSPAVTGFSGNFTQQLPFSTDFRSINREYMLNKTNEVLNWDYDYQTTLVDAGSTSDPDYYPPNTLYATRTFDENNNLAVEYVDFNGRTVLRRVQAGTIQTPINDSNFASTYYIYDDFGNLVTVLPPEAVKRLSTSYHNASALDRSTFLATWALQYKYDARRRMVEKRLPGVLPVYMIYDKRDRLVMTQDGNQGTITDIHPVKEWSFTKYDVLDRPVITGIYLTDALPNELQETLTNVVNVTSETYTGSGIAFGYTSQSFPTDADVSKYHAVTYYDIYDANIAPPAFAPANQGLPSEITAIQNEKKGQITGSLVKNLGTNTWLRTVNYYDDKYRLIHSVADHHRGTVRISQVYDFIGRVLFTQRKYVVNGTETTVKESFSYDHAGRLLVTKHSVNGNGPPDVVISANYYNELGQLVSKGLHATNPPPIDPEIGQPGTVHAAVIERDEYHDNETALIATQQIKLRNGFHKPASSIPFKGRIGFTRPEAQTEVLNQSAQTIDYRYNIRGWLTRINNSDISTISDGNSKYDLFGMELSYNTVFGGLATEPAYNGNISSMKWSKGSDGVGDIQAYTFHYDGLSRLKFADHFDYSAGAWLSNNNSYGESQTYDLNGNIQTLLRKGANGTNMDNLTYFYTGNKLDYVNDSHNANTGFINGNIGTDDYAYDNNGNLIKDRNKGIQNNDDIRYNFMNLPQEVVKGTERIKYHYDATGRKLTQEVYNNGPAPVKSTDYIGELVLENNALQFINHAEGRVVPNGNAWEYQYHLKDHLGNVRLTFTTAEDVQSVTATLETANTSQEAGKFVNYEQSVKVNAALFDHTDTEATHYSIRLNGSTSERIGLIRSMSVMPGDTVKAEVYAKYLDTNSSNWTTALTNLVTSVANKTSASGMVIDGSGAGIMAGASTPYSLLLNKSNETGSTPKPT